MNWIAQTSRSPQIDVTRRQFSLAVLLMPIMSCLLAPAGAQGEESVQIYRNRELGYTIPYPASGPDGEAPRWKRVRVDDVDLAFRARDESHLAIKSRCDVGPRDPKLLARQLLVGLKDRKRQRVEVLEFAGGEVFTQVVDALVDDRPVHAKTVTWLRGGCVVDWYLVTANPLALLEPIFDSWWRGFDPGEIPQARADVAGEPAAGDSP